ncbi:MAG: tRNA-dihydrouridine synthase family protein [archaeon]
MANFKLMLAPLEDFTDTSFRTLCFNHGADLTFTEMNKLGALAKNNKEAWDKLAFYDDTPVVVQVIGSKTDHLNIFLKKFEPKSGFSGINLNFGCPDPEVVGEGQGCALIKRSAKAKEMVDIIHDFGYKASIKTRLGLNSLEKEKKVYLKLIENSGADYYIVHARHGKESYNEPADSSVFENCAKTGMEIIANGDITKKEQIDSLKAIGIKGAMIGRAAIKNPAIFEKLNDEKETNLESLKKEYEIICKKFNSSQKYYNNVMKWFGKP